jgi:hypothetical protein
LADGKFQVIQCLRDGTARDEYEAGNHQRQSMRANTHDRPSPGSARALARRRYDFASVDRAYGP